MSITAALALFFLLAICGLVYFVAARLKVPYTVLLVAVGTFILVPLSYLPYFAFIKDFSLTPELLFYIFLPGLIFESAYNIPIRRFMSNVRTVSLLAIGSLLISALFTGFVLTYLLNLIGFPVPFIVILLFGALIAATDPVAVLALFKEFGAPRRLTLLFEGESIFNDGTAVALFLVILEIALVGFHGVSSVLEGLQMFLMMVIGGIIFGILMGGLFTKIIGWAHDNEFVQITFMIVLAHLTFVSTEFISQNLTVFGHPIHISAIIATTLAAMLVGNYGRSKIAPHAEEFIEKFWGQFAFLTNSLVFILIGLIFASLPIDLKTFALPMILAILVVAIGRAFSIYPIVALGNWLSGEERVPRAWTHLLAWGSLRGALAVSMVLLIPDTLAIPGWAYTFTPKEFILAITLGCIFTTLFLKATTIKWVMEKLGINNFTDIEKLEYKEARALIHAFALLRLNDFAQKGYIQERDAEALTAEHRARYEEALAECDTTAAHNTDLAERAVRLYAIGIEKHHLKELYEYGEISERIFKDIMRKLIVQQERVDAGLPAPAIAGASDHRDVFEKLADAFKMLVYGVIARTSEEDYMYYRAQSILARKVLKELLIAEERGTTHLFGVNALINVRGLYEDFRQGAQKKMEEVRTTETPGVMHLSGRLARKGLFKVESNTLEELYEREMITPKIYIAMKEELAAEVEEQADRDESAQAHKMA